MKIKDLIWNLWTYLTSDREKLQFMKQLMKISEDHPEINDHLQNMTLKSVSENRNSTEYLEELFEYWKTGSDLMMKLKNDMNQADIK